MNYDIKNLKDRVYKSHEIMRQVGVLTSFGVNTRLSIDVIDDKVAITLRSIKISKLFLETKQIKNEPIVHTHDFRVENIDMFQLEKASKYELKESAIRSGLSPKNSSFEIVVENIYQQSLADTIIQQMIMKDELIQLLNLNLVFLREVIENFCEQENKPKMRLKW